MTNQISFVVFVHPEPQGSSKGFGFQRGNGKIGVSITSDNIKLKPYRHTVTQVALEEIHKLGEMQPIAGKHVPVRIELRFYLERPASISKKRLLPVVKPDLDKLIRSTFDSLTGVLYFDDAQIVQTEVMKEYGSPERVEVTMKILQSGTALAGKGLQSLFA